MKNNVKLISILSLLLILAVTLCSCAEEDTSQDTSQDTGTMNLAIVGVNRANQYALPTNHGQVRDAVYETCYRWGSVVFVTSDGSPKIAYGCRVEAPSKRISNSKRMSLASEYCDQIRAIAAQLYAEAPQADCLEAIRTAGYELSNADGSERVMLVLDNGLTTEGYLNYAENPGLLDTDPQAVLTALEAVDALPQLNGITIYWFGCGETTAPQPSLSQAQKNNLEATWRTVLEASGATVSFLPGVTSGVVNDTAALPPVDLVQTSEKTLAGLLPTRVFTEDEIAFEGNSAEFKDPAAATAACQDIAAQLKASPEKTVLVYGQTAGGVNGTDDLALARADAVADLLMSLGVSERQLKVAGHAGSNSPFYIPDLDDSGMQIQALAQQNRAVRIMDSEGSDAALALQ